MLRPSSLRELHFWAFSGLASKKSRAGAKKLLQNHAHSRKAVGLCDIPQPFGCGRSVLKQLV